MIEFRFEFMILATLIVVSAVGARKIERFTSDDDEGPNSSTAKFESSDEDTQDNNNNHGRGRSQTTTGSHYSYEVNAEDWPEDYPVCKGKRQSPINIELSDVQNMDPGRPPLSRFGYDAKPTSMRIINNGHTVELTGTWPARDVPTIYGGPLTGLYELAQIHFHWGAENDVGSEHTVANQTYSLEMHMVHWKKSYRNISEASNHDDGLAVIGCLMSVDKSANIGLERIRANFHSILNPNESTNIEPFPISLFDIDIAKEGYVTYLGSLTTPPCTESVIWLISIRIKDVTMDELDSFRKLKLTNYDEHNYRSTQPLNGRRITYFHEAPRVK